MVEHLHVKVWGIRFPRARLLYERICGARRTAAKSVSAVACDNVTSPQAVEAKWERKRLLLVVVPAQNAASGMAGWLQRRSHVIGAHGRNRDVSKLTAAKRAMAKKKTNFVWELFTRNTNLCTTSHLLCLRQRD